MENDRHQRQKVLHEEQKKRCIEIWTDGDDTMTDEENSAIKETYLMLDAMAKKSQEMFERIFNESKETFGSVKLAEEIAKHITPKPLEVLACMSAIPTIDLDGTDWEKKLNNWGAEGAEGQEKDDAKK